MESRMGRGVLVLLGGAVTPRGAALREFVRRSQQTSRKRVIAITTASGDPDAAARLWRQDLKTAGCAFVDCPRIITRMHACDVTLAEQIATADAIFLGGGDQVKLVSVLAGTPVEGAIHAAHHNGAVIAGTSAGAAALAKTTLAGNEVDDYGNLVEQYIGPGLGFIHHPAIIDTHFSQRRRLFRLFGAIAEYPSLLGLGIDEDTALVVDDDRAYVSGTGNVTFVDGRGITYTNAGQVPEGRALTLSALRVGLLGPGPLFDFQSRDVVTKEKEH